MKGRMLRFFSGGFFFSATLGNYDAESKLENGARSNQDVWQPRLLQINFLSVATAIAWMPRRTTLLNTIMKHRTTAEKIRSAMHFVHARIFGYKID